MAIPNGLLSNPVIAGLLGRGGPAGIKAQKDAELAAMRRGVQGGRIPAPGAARPVAVDSLGKGLSSLGASLQGIADMRKARAKRQAIIDSRAPITTTERVMTAPQKTVNVPGQFNKLNPTDTMNAMTPDGIPIGVDATARAQEFLKEEDDPYAQRIGEQALVALNNAAEPGLPPGPASDERDRQIAMANTIRQQDNEKAAELLGLQYTPGFQKVVAEKYEDQERTRTPTLNESADRLLAGGYVTEAANLASIANARESAQTNRIKAIAAAKKAGTENTFVEGSPKQAEFMLKVEKNHENAKDTVTYREARRSYDAIVGASKDNSPISDLDLIFGIAKIFDPTSVVRGSEVNAVNEIGGLPQIVYRAAGRLQGGQTLTDKTRKEIVAAGTRRIKTYEKSYGMRVKKTKAIADRYKFDYSLVGLTDDDTRFFPVTYKFGD